jgi:hypothetical protein
MTGIEINGAPPVREFLRTSCLMACRLPRSQLLAFVAAAFVLGSPGCDFAGGKSGVTAPLDRIFLPSGGQVVNSGRRLLVVNSNLDLRYSTGTVVPIDLSAVALDRNKGTWNNCPSVDFRPIKNEGRFCCKDLLDPRVLNCDDRPYADIQSTVLIGSFGTAPVLQNFSLGEKKVERMFFAVRADPSVTFVDAFVEGGKPALRCTGTATGTTLTATGNAQCSGDYRVQSGFAEGNKAGSKVDLPEEPFDVQIDPDLGVLYVGHLVGGISSLDVCGPELGALPRLSGVLSNAYSRAEGSGGVMSTIPSVPGDPTAPLFTTARAGFRLGQVYLRDGKHLIGGCTTSDARDLTLVASEPTAATAFVPRGQGTRGLVYQANRGRAFILHHNTLGQPAALSRVRIAKDNLGEMQFAPEASIDVCAGPSQMQLHRNGRGERLFITCFDSGQVYVVEPDSMVVSGEIDVGRGPSMLIFDQNDQDFAYVTGFIDNNISVIDLRVNSPTEARVIQRIGFPRTSTQL